MDSLIHLFIKSDIIFFFLITWFMDLLSDWVLDWMITWWIDGWKIAFNFDPSVAKGRGVWIFQVLDPPKVAIFLIAFFIELIFLASWRPGTFLRQFCCLQERSPGGWCWGSFIDWLVDWLLDWLIDWLIGWLVGWFDYRNGSMLREWMLDELYFGDWLGVWVIDWIDWVIDWVSVWLTDWLIGWLTDWLTDWLIYWLIDWSLV